MTRRKSLFVGFVIGGTISVATVLLSTPSSGQNLRHQVKRQSIEWRTMVNNLTQDAQRLKNQITKTSKEGVALINQLTQEMKKSVEDWKVAVEPHQENIHEYLNQIESSLKDLEKKVKKE